MLSAERIAGAVANCVVQAGTTFRRDQLRAYRTAIQRERNPKARWALERILENARAAKRNSAPLCDDTGIPHVFVEWGQDLQIPMDWLSAVGRGVTRGLRAMPGRPMAVRGNPVERVEQSRGLIQDPGKVAHAPVITKAVPGRGLAITVLLLGGGPEIRARTFRIFHKRSMILLLEEAAGWLCSQVQELGCTPCIPAIGIGRTHMEASTLMVEAMKEGSLNRQSRWEKKITERLNATGTGPLGLGGTTTALGAFIKVGPSRASGVRIVSVRPCCCVEPRRATVVLRR